MEPWRTLTFKEVAKRQEEDRESVVSGKLREERESQGENTSWVKCRQRVQREGGRQLTLRTDRGAVGWKPGCRGVKREKTGRACGTRSRQAILSRNFVVKEGGNIRW